jgi:hypothetical protein
MVRIREVDSKEEEGKPSIDTASSIGRNDNLTVVLEYSFARHRSTCSYFLPEVVVFKDLR